MDKRSIFFRLLSYFNPYKLYFILVTVLIFANAGLTIIAPYLSGIVFYNKELGGDPNQLEFWGFKTQTLSVNCQMVMIQNWQKTEIIFPEVNAREWLLQEQF